MFLTMTMEIWGFVRQTYSIIQDAFQIYNIKTKIRTTMQGTLSIIECFNMMKSLWVELDYSQNFKMKCNSDSIIMQNLLKERIFKFLVNLNVKND